jgi:hypothetical protein
MANPTTDDFATYLDVDSSTLNTARAQMMLDQATALAAAIVSPLPDGSDAIILSAAARAFVNPTGVTSETVGPYSVQRPWPGVYLTKAERSSLRRLAGKSAGAFTIDPTSVDAMADYVDPLNSPDIDDSESFAENYPVEW